MQHMWGRYFDDYTVGEVIKHWPGRTIRDFDDTWFTLLTMNTNPIHFDDHFASQSQHGRCLVNGTLVFAIVVGMSVRDISQTAIANLEYESVKHLGPTFHGDTLYAESEILEKTDSIEAGPRRPLRRDARVESARGTGDVAAPPRPAAAAARSEPPLLVRACAQFARPRARSAWRSTLPLPRVGRSLFVDEEEVARHLVAGQRFAAVRLQIGGAAGWRRRGRRRRRRSRRASDAAPARRARP